MSEEVLNQRIAELSAENDELKKQIVNLQRDVATTAASRDTYKKGFETQSANHLRADADVKDLLKAAQDKGIAVKRVDGHFTIVNVNLNVNGPGNEPTA